MGTIRNRVVIVHHFDKKKLEEIRQDAIKTFQEVADTFYIREYDVGKDMVSPILTGLCNTEYTFVINGECSKLGWEESKEFQEVREEWCEKHKNDVCNMLMVDFGEEFDAEVKEFKPDEEE